VFTLRFSDEETLPNLERTAAALGVSTTELAEAAIERELTLLGSDQEHRLARALERLKSAGLTGLEQDIQDFARSELQVEDPLRASRAESRDQAQTETGDSRELLGSKVDETITVALHRLGVPTREEIRNLTRRVEELNAKVELLRPRITPAAPAAREMPAANKSAGKSQGSTPSSRGNS
jgi:DNA anti-recombination protein RmuC